MPVSAPPDTTPSPCCRLAARWRDLPATPPLADFLPPPDPDHLVAPGRAVARSPRRRSAAASTPEPEKPRSRKRTWVAIGLAAAVARHRRPR